MSTFYWSSIAWFFPLNLRAFVYFLNSIDKWIIRCLIWGLLQFSATLNDCVCVRVYAFVLPAGDPRRSSGCLKIPNVSPVLPAAPRTSLINGTFYSNKCVLKGRQSGNRLLSCLAPSSLLSMFSSSFGGRSALCYVLPPTGDFLQTLLVEPRVILPFFPHVT